MKILSIFLLLLICSCSSFINHNIENKISGSEVITLLDTLNLQSREDKVFDLIKNKNYPQFLNNFSEIKVIEKISGKNYELKYYVLPDYFSIGNDTNYFYIPMTPILAQKIADLFDCILPTRKIVNQIYLSSIIKYYPQPIAPSPEMVTIKVFAKHNDSIKIQKNNFFANIPLGALSSGHKKDVIISNLIYTNLKQNVPKPVVIYGWHKKDGTPIQPAYNGHTELYADYSHGIRLVKKKAFLNGKEIILTDILKDTVLCQLISDEGVIEKSYYNISK